MYQALAYIVYRTVLEYYSGDPDEDAYGKFLSLYKCSSNKGCYFVKMNFKLADVILFQKIYGLIT